MQSHHRRPPRPDRPVDLVYIAYKLIIEYEGDQHRTDRNQWNRDIDRQEDFARDNWMLIRVTSERAR
jgi:very-short-patch-repair endonuclease